MALDKQPFGWPRDESVFVTLHHQLGVADHNPATGVTQGGSSRKDRGARVAARTDSEKPKDLKQKPIKEKPNG